MRSPLKLLYLFAAAFKFVASATGGPGFEVRPFKINLSGGVPRMKSLIDNTRLPTKPLYDVGQDMGIELDVLRKLRSEWLDDFDWDTQQAELNEFHHYTAVIEGQTVHFIHERSAEEDAIPLILVHGWPGSFQEFIPVIKPLTQPAKTSSGKRVSYNVVVPSLPGFVFSSPPPLNWTVRDTARIFNTLMTDVLGYPTFALHGTDWGSAVAYSLYSSFNETVRAGHFVWVNFVPPTPQELVEKNITLSPAQNITERRSMDWETTGQGYLNEQATKPNDVGFALYDSPVGQLAWIAAKFKLWSDPRAGTPPSLLTNTAILTSVSLYYLTDSFLSAVWIYAQNTDGFPEDYTMAPTDAPMLFSQFGYNIGFWPQEYVALVGNLVSYKFHTAGGHFAGLENPPALIEDIREMGDHYVGGGPKSPSNSFVNQAEGIAY
ncbi:Alpha/Beta hydrolase protein [Mycena metata]|uniref:Alpha/Beta hydrolase protein n=1 Tax=Mycena metata TaxID=1033252 RepID=A0AAD7JXI7_9AGAR|nr:Alpha/Beta hydrolase protein [Mycena metata]